MRLRKGRQTNEASLLTQAQKYLVRIRPFRTMTMAETHTVRSRRNGENRVGGPRCGTVADHEEVVIVVYQIEGGRRQ